MAQVRVVNKLGGVLKFVGRFSPRARALPGGYELRPTGKLAAIHHGGASTRVTPAMRGALAVITGMPPPRVGKVLEIPARPVSTDAKMARDVAVGVAKNIIKGKPVPAERIMKSGVKRQFASRRGWAKARPWGKWKTANPNPLGGPGGRVAAGWEAGRVREVR